MKANATTAPPNAVSGRIKPKIHYRIRKYAEEHPDASQFVIVSRDEAAELLLTIAATIHLGLDSESDPVVRKAMRSAANGMRAAVSTGLVYEHLHQLGEQEFFGLKIVVPIGVGEA